MLSTNLGPIIIITISSKKLEIESKLWSFDRNVLEVQKVLL